MLTAEAFPPFRPRPPWVNGDLQTLRNYLRRPVFDLSPFPGERLALPTRDGSGDTLLGDLNRPPDQGGRPLAVLIHGLTGCSTGTYMLASAFHLLSNGYPVLRLNLRGAGPARKLCRQQYHAGRSGDLRDAFAALPANLVRNGIFAVGYSLGGNMLLKHLAEQGGDGPVRAATTVSAPIDLKAASLRLMRPRNRIYHDWLIRRMQEEALAGEGLDARERATVAAVRRVWDFDDRFVAPRNGFAGAEDYYARSSGLRHLQAIKVPTLIVHALDDPWIPGTAYTGLDWRASPKLLPLLPAQGGHVGFHGRGSGVPWHDRCLEIFLETLYPRDRRPFS